MSEIVTNKQGGKNSNINIRFDLIPAEVIESLARTLAQGAERYDDWNWLKVTSHEHYNHMMYHLFSFPRGTDPKEKEEHLSHFFCRAMMLYFTAGREARPVTRQEELEAAEDGVSGG